MKIEEIIKEFRENPRKKFKRKIDGLVMELGVNETLLYEGGYRHLSLSDEWEEVKEPVSFLQALEMIKNNKATKFSLINRKHCIDWINIDLHELLYRLIEYTNLSESANEIIEEILLDSEYYIAG